MVTEWLLHNKNQIQIFYLPKYSPDLNPREYLKSLHETGVSKGATAPQYG
jgi:transposase